MLVCVVVCALLCAGVRLVMLCFLHVCACMWLACFVNVVVCFVCGL